MNFTQGNNYTYSQNELGQFYGLYYNLMQHWQQIEGIGLIDISYEELINDQKTQTQRLLDACGLEWNDACLDFHKSDRPVMTASVNQVREKLYNKSIQRWKHFEDHLTPLINTLNNVLPDTQVTQ
jgi:LPS sulfotransferase NodH